MRNLVTLTTVSLLCLAASGRTPCPGHGSAGGIALVSLVAPILQGASQSSELRDAVGEVEALREQGDADTARTLLAELVQGGLYSQLLLTEPAIALAELDVLYAVAETLNAEELRERIGEDRVSLLTENHDPEHPEVLSAKLDLGVSRLRLGNGQGALELLRLVHDARERRLPADDPDLLRSKRALGIALFNLRDLEAAHVLLEEAHEGRERTLPPGHPDLLQAKATLATARMTLGDLDGALVLAEAVHSARERALPADDPELLEAKLSLGEIRQELGDLPGALALLEEVHEVRGQTLPEEDPLLLRSKETLAATRGVMGDLRGAMALQEQVDAVRSRLLPEGHHELIRIKLSLAITRRALGDLEGALEVMEYVHAVWQRILPNDDPDLQHARQGLADVRSRLGDHSGALALREQVLDARERVLPDDHPELLRARERVALSRERLGDGEGARDLLLRVLEARERRLPAEHPDILQSKFNIAITYPERDAEKALALYREVYEARRKRYPEEHPLMLSVKAHLGIAHQALGNTAKALAFFLEVHAAREKVLAPEHPDLSRVRWSIAVARETLGDLEGAREFAQLLLSSHLAVANALRTSAPRMANASARRELHWLYSGPIGAQLGPTEPGQSDLAPLLLETVETLRAVSVISREAALASQELPRVAELRARAAAVRQDLSRLSANPPSGEDIAAWKARISELAEERDRVERAVRKELALNGVMAEVLTAEAIADRLDHDAVFVSFFRHVPDRDKALREVSARNGSLAALVVTPNAEVRCVPMGEYKPIEDLVVQWRAALGCPVDPAEAPTEPGDPARGLTVGLAAAAEDEVQLARRLREELIDPWLAALGEEQPAKLHVVLDEPLHLVPLDALAWTDGRRLGEVFKLRTETSAARLVGNPSGGESDGALVAIGGVDFGASDRGGAGAADSEAAPRGAFGTLAPLPGTEVEVEELAELFAAQHPGLESHVLTGPMATKSALRERAPGARYLHLATHGWFAPEAVAAGFERASGGVPGEALQEAEDTLVALAPETLCGLALAGANSVAPADGGNPGIMTAEEVAALNLSRCELAVLSACETNVGVRSAGQGIQSLQSALHAAGVRSALTSLWRVDDAATQRLMKLFYRGLWEEGLGKADALWAAKSRLAAEGLPTKHWAGWVLTGDPN